MTKVSTKPWAYDENSCPWEGGARVTMDEPDFRIDCLTEYAREIVASHNACAGLSVSALEAGRLSDALAALRGLVGMKQWNDLDDPEFKEQRDRYLERAEKALNALRTLEDDEHERG